MRTRSLSPLAFARAPSAARVRHRAFVDRLHRRTAQRATPLRAADLLRLLASADDAGVRR